MLLKQNKKIIQIEQGDYQRKKDKRMFTAHNVCRHHKNGKYYVEVTPTKTLNLEIPEHPSLYELHSFLNEFILIKSWE